LVEKCIKRPEYSIMNFISSSVGGSYIIKEVYRKIVIHAPVIVNMRVKEYKIILANGVVYIYISCKIHDKHKFKSTKILNRLKLFIVHTQILLL